MHRPVQQPGKKNKENEKLLPSHLIINRTHLQGGEGARRARTIFTEISLQEDERKLCAMATTLEDGSMSPELVGLIKQLWCDGGTQACFARAAEYQLSDSAAQQVTPAAQQLDAAATAAVPHSGQPGESMARQPEKMRGLIRFIFYQKLEETSENKVSETVCFL